MITSSSISITWNSQCFFKPWTKFPSNESSWLQQRFWAASGLGVHCEGPKKLWLVHHNFWYQFHLVPVQTKSCWFQTPEEWALKVQVRGQQCHWTGWFPSTSKILHPETGSAKKNNLATYISFKIASLPCQPDAGNTSRSLSPPQNRKQAASSLKAILTRNRKKKYFTHWMILTW